MTEPAAPHAATLPPASANGSAPPPRPAPAAPRRRLKAHISGMRTAPIADAGVLIVVLILIIQDAHAVNISFLGAHLRLPLAVALLLAAVTGADHRRRPDRADHPAAHNHAAGPAPPATRPAAPGR